MPITARKPSQHLVSLVNAFDGRWHGHVPMLGPCRLHVEAVAPAGRPRPHCDLLRRGARPRTSWGSCGVFALVVALSLPPHHAAADESMSSAFEMAPWQ